MKPELKPATKGDFETLMGISPPYRIRAYSGYLGDELIGIGGFAFMPDGTVAAFAKLTDTARQYPMFLHKAGIFVMGKASEFGIRRASTVAQAEIKPARKWLSLLGFQPEIIEDMEIWIWQTQ